jgi:uncharacterized membrane protein
MSDLTPPPPPSYSPPPPPPAGGAVSPNRKVMIVLSYLWLLALIPLLVEKDDQEVQWHAKNGLVLTLCEILVMVVLGIVSHFVACLGCFVWPIVFIAFLVVRILCIVKGVNGDRFIIPVLSDYTNKF